MSQLLEYDVVLCLVSIWDWRQNCSNTTRQASCMLLLIRGRNQACPLEGPRCVVGWSGIPQSSGKYCCVKPSATWDGSSLFLGMSKHFQADLCSTRAFQTQNWASSRQLLWADHEKYCPKCSSKVYRTVTVLSGLSIYSNPDMLLLKSQTKGINI